MENGKFDDDFVGKSFEQKMFFIEMQNIVKLEGGGKLLKESK